MPKKALRGLSGIKVFELLENTETNYKVGEAINIPYAQKLTRDIQTSNDPIYADDEIYDDEEIFDGEDFHVMGVMEHIEPAGIHSGDSNAVLPAFNLTPLIVHTMEEYAEKIARELDIRGLINIQFAIKDGKVYVIEANPRASRTTPFIAKAYQIPYLNIATKIMMGVNKLKDFTYEKKLTGFAIKEPVFSFDKFPNVNKELGPEMKSTGEAIRFIKDLRDPYFRKLYKDRSMYLSK